MGSVRKNCAAFWWSEGLVEMAEGIERMLTYYALSFVLPFRELSGETIDEQMEEWEKVNHERDSFKAFIDYQLKPIFAGQLPDWIEVGEQVRGGGV